MEIFEKKVNKVVIIDVFKESERFDPQFNVSQPLNDYLFDVGINVYIFFPADKQSFLDLLDDLAKESGDGIIIHLAGHGINTREAFGNDLKEYWITWEEAIPYFDAINQAYKGGLILNLTLMCYSDGLLNFATLPRPYQAALVSQDPRSLQALLHNKRWYEKSLKKDQIIAEVKVSNDNLEYNLAYRPYKVDFRGRQYT